MQKILRKIFAQKCQEPSPESPPPTYKSSKILPLQFPLPKWVKCISTLYTFDFLSWRNQQIGKEKRNEFQQLFIGIKLKNISLGKGRNELNIASLRPYYEIKHCLRGNCFNNFLVFSLHFHPEIVDKSF